MNETQYGYGMQSIKTSSPACYYCRVTDRSTGKYVESNYVWIAKKLYFDPIGAYSIEGGNKASCWCLIGGGIPPYRVNVYATVNGSSVFCGETVIQKEGNAWVHFDAYFTTAPDKVTGEMRNVLCPFSFRVTDCSGQTVRFFPNAEEIHYAVPVSNG